MYHVDFYFKIVSTFLQSLYFCPDWQFWKHVKMVHDKKKYFQTVYKSYEMHCVQLRNVDNTVIYMQGGGK